MRERRAFSYLIHRARRHHRLSFKVCNGLTGPYVAGWCSCGWRWFAANAGTLEDWHDQHVLGRLMDGLVRELRAQTGHPVPNTTYPPPRKPPKRPSA